MGNMIDIDVTALIQFVNTIIALLVANFLLIRPIRRQIKARRDITSGLAAEIGRFTHETSSKLAEYEHALAEARTAAVHEREQVRADAMRKEEELIAEAHAKSNDFLADFRKRTAAEADEARQHLRQKADYFANLAIDRLLN